jgi:ATP-dependent Clp protease ATP-binding subunit ClpA
MTKILVGLLPVIFCANVFAQDSTAAAPDLSTLAQSGFIMGPGDATNKIDRGYQDLTAVMKNVSAFDDIIARISAVVCGTDQNKSVLLIGEPSLAYQYIFARMASNTNSKCGPNMWHVDINVSKIEAGHHYVGDVDEYWQEKILTPADGKDVVMYLDSVGALVGIGSHSNDDTGIEREYAANITQGRMRSVGFIDKYEYNDIIRSKNSYVLEAFADRIVLPPVDATQTYMLADVFMKTLHPNLVLGDPQLKYIIKTIEFYAPNRQEPDRTMSVINELIRSAKGGAGKPVNYPTVIESEHPYKPNTRVEFTVDKPDVQALSLVFDTFDVETNYDYLEIRNGKDNSLLETIKTQNLTSFETQVYPTNKLKLVFVTDGTGVQNGFKISAVKGLKFETKVFTLEEARKATMAVAQVPSWLVDRDYTVIKDLKGKLDGDVVGVAEGKRDLVRLAKNGYVAGRTDNKPVGTVLLAGPTGTGKSYIAQKMGEFMGMKLITMDMTAYKDQTSFRTFVDTMARNLTNSPFAVYLFEEIDKANVAVLDQLFFMMDEGIFYDSFQRPLFARGAFIIMTTNAGAEVILNNPNDPDLRDKVLKDLRTKFRDSFLNRFDAISLFKPFTEPEFRQLAATLVNKKVSRIKSFYDWTMTVDDGTLAYISTYGRSAEYGARPMERLVEGTLGIGIAEYQLAYGAIPGGSSIALTKLADTHAFRLTIGNKFVDFTADEQSMQSYFQNMELFKLHRALKGK